MKMYHTTPFPNAIFFYAIPHRTAFYRMLLCHTISYRFLLLYPSLSDGRILDNKGECFVNTVKYGLLRLWFLAGGKEHLAVGAVEGEGKLVAGLAQV